VKPEGSIMAESGLVFDIKRYAIHDGPGIRTTVFLKGCLLSCPWCHNPEGKSRTQEFMWWQERCLECNDCLSACTKGAISFPNKFLRLDQMKCDLCRDCVEACHSQALKLVGKEMTVDQVVREIEKDNAFYDQSGGGMTISGGEPLLQPDFAGSLLNACRKRGIHTAVDTCGYVDWEILSEISKYADLFLYDLKSIDDEKHQKYTGVSNRTILENLKKLSENGQPLIVRFPLVPGINDDDRDIQKLGEFVSSLDRVKMLSLLPYHRGGCEKLNRLLVPADSSFKGESPSPQRESEIIRKLEGFGLKVQIGG
jgi:pyruvate formate lyase activating enzyme